MGIFETQFGGIPLINTYQFKEGPRLPDISGFRGLAQGRRASGALPGRQADSKPENLKGLEGEVATYRMEAAALDAEVQAEMNRMYNRFENDFSGSWDDFWDAEQKNITNRLLDFQTRYALLDGYRQSMASHRDRYDDVIKNKDIAGNVALRPVGNGFMVFGQRRDGRGFDWGDSSEIVRPLTGAEAAEYINKHTRVGQQVFFPVEFAMNKHHDDLVEHFRQVKNQLSGGSSSYNQPYDPTNPYSPIVSGSNSFKANRDAINNIVNRAYYHLTPEGRMSLYADAQKNLMRYVVRTDEGNFVVEGIPNYIISMSTDRNGRSIMRMEMEMGPDGNPVLLDLNNPREYQAALESYARFVAANQGQTYLNYEVSQSQGFAFSSKEPPEPTVGINTLASNNSAPLYQRAVISGTGSNAVPINHDLARVQYSLKESNPQLASKFLNVRARFIEDHPELATAMQDKNLPVEERNVIGQMLAQYILESGEFTPDEINTIYQRQANPTFVTPMNWGQRMLNRVLGAVTFGKFTLDTGNQVAVVDNSQSGPEAFATQMFGREITIYQDLEPNISEYNRIVGFKADGPVRIAGAGTSVLNARDLNPNGLVFVAGNDLISAHPWQTPEFRQMYRGNEAYSNWQQMPVYAGRGGNFFIPKSILDETEVETISERGGQSQTEFVRRKKIKEYRQHDKDNTYTLGSDKFYSLFANKADADAVIAQIRITYGIKDPDAKIVLVPGETAILDPMTVDLGMTNKYKVRDFINQGQAAIEFQGLQNQGRAMSLPQWLREPVRQQQRSQPVTEPRRVVSVPGQGQ